jgi:hypothetical protein
MDDEKKTRLGSVASVTTYPMASRMMHKNETTITTLDNIFVGKCVCVTIFDPHGKPPSQMYGVCEKFRLVRKGQSIAIVLTNGHEYQFHPYCLLLQSQAAATEAVEGPVCMNRGSNQLRVEVYALTAD